MDRNRLLQITLVFEGGLILLAWGLGEVLAQPVFQGSFLSIQAVVWGFLVCLPLLAGLVMIYRFPWSPFLRLREDVNRVVLRLFSNCTIADLAFISTLAGIGEEAIFRGLLQKTLMDTLGLAPAIVLTSTVFGLAHFISLTYFLYATLIGVYFGIVLIALENLYVVIVAHALYDFVALVFLIHFWPLNSKKLD